MFDGFTLDRMDAGEARLRVRRVAPILAHDFAVPAHMDGTTGHELSGRP